MSDKRSIFEEVSGGAPKERKIETDVIDGPRKSARGGIRLWLVLLFVLVALMIVIGGLTRLTDSGLSITEWKPVTGALPPMSKNAWQAEFEKYQLILEFQLQNKDMDLAGFKSIFWWEWGHRQLGRLIGLVWAAGFFGFLAMRRIPTGWTGRLLALGVLGGAQGAVGWWMVLSGLTGRMVDVASYRLAIHLGLAFVILGLIVWYMMALGRGAQDMMLARRNREGGLASLATILGAVVFLQVLLGALVAGIDAGQGYIDWPMMNGEVLPSESFDYEPVLVNFFENPALVQFDHRMLGYLVQILAGFSWWKSRGSALRATKQAFDWVMAILLLQMVLGIVTVLYAAPWHIAILHQIGAIAAFAFVLRARFVAMYPAAQSLR